MDRVTKSENLNETDENVLAYAQGLDNIIIVKVACSSNITFALSDKGQLYATGTFRVCRFFFKITVYKISIVIIVIIIYILPLRIMTEIQGLL